MKAIIALWLCCLAWLVGLLLIFAVERKPKPPPIPQEISDAYDANRWLEEHADIVQRARAAVHASPTEDNK